MLKKATTQNKILNVATKLFWENNFNSVGVSLICKEARIHKGSFYHFFKSKDELMVSIVENLWQQHENNFLKPIFNQNHKPLDKIYKYANSLTKMSKKMIDSSGFFSGCPFGNSAAELSTQDPIIQKEINKIFDNYTQYFIDALKEAKNNKEIANSINPDNFAATIFATLQGSILLAKSRNNPNIINSSITDLLNLAERSYNK